MVAQNDTPQYEPPGHYTQSEFALEYAFWGPALELVLQINFVRFSLIRGINRPQTPSPEVGASLFVSTNGSL